MSDDLKSVVLIDDLEANNFLTQMILEDVECNADINAFLSAEDALKAFLEKGNTPDLIFLDINMPSMDGWQFLNEYESQWGNTNSSVIVMLSSSNNADDIERAKSYHCVKDYIVKPLTEDYCRQLLERYPEIISKLLKEAT